LPGRRFPRSRSDRSVLLFSFLCGPSEEGGREDVDESWRARRSSSSTRAESRSFSAVSRSTCPVSSAISRYAPPAAPPARRPAARTAAQPRAGQERRAQLAMITIPARQSATRPGVSPRGAMILRAMIALVTRRLAATAH
jgi:hypothetical protein